MDAVYYCREPRKICQSLGISLLLGGFCWPLSEETAPGAGVRGAGAADPFGVCARAVAGPRLVASAMALSGSLRQFWL